MAGSYAHHGQHKDDPILSARLDVLRLLADQVAAPIVIFNPDLRLVYANSLAEKVAEECPMLASAKSDRADVSGKPAEPCDACPGRQVFHIGGASQCSGPNFPLVDPLHGSCPFPNPTPLTTSGGEIGCVLMMGNKGEEPAAQEEKTKRVMQERPAVSGLREDPLEGLIGHSPFMQQLFEMIRLIAASGAPVLIQGESGTGKELVAKTLHRLSNRRDRPFVVVDCSSLPETLLESELFGHVRGAFTGAVATRKGLFEEAEGGTLFLDEIADTSPAFQAKLLRVLQEGEMKPVGSSQSVPVNVRLLSASNRSLVDLMKANAFRADLYYRLAVLPLVIPPLRDRRDNIPLLVRHFLEISSCKYEKPVLDIVPEALQRLVEAPWPGNVRELEHLIERVVVTSRKPTIDPKNG